MSTLLRIDMHSRHLIHIFFFFWHICFHCYFVGVSVLCNPAISVGLQRKEVKGREHEFPCFWFYNSINNQESENVRDPGWLKGCRILHFWGRNFGPVASQEWLNVTFGKLFDELFRTLWWSLSTCCDAVCFMKASTQDMAGNHHVVSQYIEWQSKALSCLVRLILPDSNEACGESNVAAPTYSVLLVLRE